MRRVVVIGTSGSGKTTLARELSGRIGAAMIELDELHWGANWTPRGDFSQRVRAAMGASDRWVIDGNYQKVRPLMWQAADVIVWLDYPMRLVFNRVLRRTFRRWWRRDELWCGNRERLWTQFCTADSLLLWVIQTWRKHRRDYPKLLQEAAEEGKMIVRLRSPTEAELWMSQIGAAG